MKKHRLARNIKAEDAYVRDMARVSAFDKLDAGEAAVLTPDDYPEPIRRFLQRERSIVRILRSMTLGRIVTVAWRDAAWVLGHSIGGLVFAASLRSLVASRKGDQGHCPTLRV